MSEGKVKLFGKTIRLPETYTTPEDAEEVEIVETVESSDGETAAEGRSDQESPCAEAPGLKKSRSVSEQDDKKDGNLAHPLASLELKDSSMPAQIDDQAVQTSKTKEDQTQTGNSLEKGLKKPEKILPCPRCNSMDTKFCYFNNYNTNQPRHFCKICQRYWTAGGTMRNVPVGAGRRKNKTSISQFRHVNVPEGLQSARVDLTNGIQRLVMNTNGGALCESMVSVLNIAEKAMKNSSSHGFHQTGEPRNSVSLGSTESGDDQCSKSSIATSKNVMEKNLLQEPLPECHPYTPQMQCFPGVLQPYPWQSVQWSSMIPAPVLAPASFPLPFYSASPPFWGCAIPGSWSVPWVVPTTPTASHSPVPPSSGPISPTLGKHSREDNIVKTVNPAGVALKETSPERFLWVPKTLRIDDPGEAAKSSIWATLGIKKDEVDSVRGGSLFKAFRSHSSKGGETQDQETCTVLQANPAAMSRSLSFHESS